MGNTCSGRSAVVTGDNSTASEPISSTSYPVPFGHVAYTPSLPGAMGPIWDFPLEWWYYAGWATDVTGTKHYTILMQTVRVEKNAALLYGIGFHQVGSQDQLFATNFVLGGPDSGGFPTPTSKSWFTSFQSSLPPATMDCKLTSGVLGLSGAKYELSMSDVTKEISAKFLVKDNLGMVLEGASGAFHKAGGTNSYEYAAPCLAIQEGSTITMKGEEIQLAAGNLWLDRQTIGGVGQSHQDLLGTSDSQSSSGKSKPLYTGNWIVVHMNDKTIYNIVFIWPKKPEQWIVGTKVVPPVYPLSKIGLEYPALSTWNEDPSPVQGVKVLKSTEFDLNILNPENPSSSPHWTSPKSGQTYCSAWHLRIKEKVYTIKVLIPGSEVHLGTYFFEGAAILTDENGCKVGNAYVEQMGYN